MLDVNEQDVDDIAAGVVDEVEKVVDNLDFVYVYVSLPHVFSRLDELS